jgi:hypothetical protein
MIALGSRRSWRIATSPEACRTGADRSAERGGSRHAFGHAPGGLRQGDGLAVAGTVRGRGCRRLLRDKSRLPGKTPLPKAVVERVVELTLGEPPGEATHWSGRAMAAAAGISLR